MPQCHSHYRPPPHPTLEIAEGLLALPTSPADELEQAIREEFEKLKEKEHG